MTDSMRPVDTRGAGAWIARKWLASALVGLAALALGWFVFATVSGGRTRVLMMGDAAHTSVGVVTILRWDLAPPRSPDSEAREGEEGEEGEEEEGTASLLPGHVLSAVEFRSCANKPGGTQADLRRFHLVMADGSRAALVGTTATGAAPQCQRGLLFFQTPEGKRPAFVLFESSPSVEWRVRSS
jgi:hypothetical protein